MKTRFFLALAIVALSWMGCSQEEEVVNQLQGGANTIYATLESSTRSTVTDAGEFSWATGDQITVLDEYNTNMDTYTYSGTGNGFDIDGTKKVTEPVVAYYPANNSHTTATFYLPATYGDTNTEYVADTHAAMIATPPTSGNTYAFMHLGGVMRFNVKNVPDGTTAFSFTAIGKDITGNFTVTDSESVKTIATADGSNSTVTINFKALTEAKDMTFYVPLPTGTYGDYTVALKIGNETKSCPSTNVTNTIKRKTLLLMPTFTYNGTDLGKSLAKVGVVDLEEGNKSADISEDADVVVTPGTDAEDADAVATLNYTPANDGLSVLSISDGSAEGTASGESEGKVVVATDEDATVAALNINAPKLTVELSAAESTSVTYTEVTALTAQQTLIIGEGVTINNLIINGGNVIIFGTVTNITNNGEGSISYDVKTLDELKTAIDNENITHITLGADITLTETCVINKAITLDLNGKTITANTNTEYAFNISGNATITNGTIVTDSKYAFVVDNAERLSDVEFTDLTITATRSDNNGPNGTVILVGNADVTLGADVEITAEGYSCVVEGSTHEVAGENCASVTINGASLTLTSESDQGTVIGAGYGSTITVNSGTIDGSSSAYAACAYPTGGTVNITGGTIKGALHEYTTQDVITDVIVTGGTFTDASVFDYLAEEASIKLGKTITLAKTITIKANTTLNFDLNGYDLSYAVSNDGKASAIFDNRGTLNIVNTGDNKDAKLTFTAVDPDLQEIPGYATNTITNESTLTISENVTVCNDSNGGASYAVDNKGVFTLNGGKLIGNRCALRVAKYNQDNVFFEMNSGVIEAQTPAWIQLPGSDANTKPTITVEINDGTLQSTKESNDANNVMYTYSFGNSHANTKITINGGNFLGGTVSIGSGYKGDAPTLNINGGTFEYDVLQWLANDECKILYNANKQ